MDTCKLRKVIPRWEPQKEMYQYYKSNFPLRLNLFFYIFCYSKIRNSQRYINAAFHTLKIWLLSEAFPLSAVDYDKFLNKKILASEK